MRGSFLDLEGMLVFVSGPVEVRERGTLKTFRNFGVLSRGGSLGRVFFLLGAIIHELNSF